LQGAKYAEEKIKLTLLTDIIGNVIASHHNGLFNNITDGESTLSVKVNKGEDYFPYEEAKKQFSPDINEAELTEEILNFFQPLQTKELSPDFMLHLLTKVLYSCLVDADRCDAAKIIPDNTSSDWTKLIQQLEEYLSDPNIIDRTNSLYNARTRISEQCRLEGSSRNQGIYTLSVPTGGGKTLSSLRFALEHAKEHNLKRIIYVIPYLSILDQTADDMHKVFKDNSNDLIFEHHSNIEVPEKDDDVEQYNLLASRWDSPIILTTMVQFLETIYSNKASKLRKFHNMSESVLIFDEIQALPIRCIHLFNDTINFLQTFGKSTTLLCTATQPHLHETNRPVLLSSQPDIVTITQEELKIFERVRIEDKTKPEMDHEQIATLAKTQIEQGKSTLVILNTKSDACKVYEQCKSTDCEKVFLTTDLCPAHRLDVLEQLKKNLKSESKRLTLCVSTQLIEAGVNISFDCVIRAQAGLDSIIQAAGRCNRNKENQTPQSVFVVNVKNENLERLPEIEEGKDITETVFDEKRGKDILSDEMTDLFYYYYFKTQKNKMDYDTKDGKTTIYSLLNDNLLDAVAYKNRNNEDYSGLPCAFQVAADEFSVIDEKQIGIVVPYEDALKRVSDFQRCYDPKEKMRILKDLQKYTVSVYPYVLEKLGEQVVKEIDDTFYCLRNSDYYSKEKGLLLQPDLQFLSC